MANRMRITTMRRGRVFGCQQSTAFLQYPWLRRGFGTGLAALLLLLASPAAAQEGLEPDPDFNKGGRTAFQFLKIGLGARQAGMGEAGLAVVRDVNAVFWNPANISGIENAEASFSYVSWLADMSYVAGAVGTQWDGIGTFALSIASLDYGDIPEAVTGRDEDARTGGTISGGDLLFGLSYSRMFTDRLSIGATAKYVHESLWDFGVGTFSFDVGTIYDLGFKGITLAMSAQNFAGSVNWRGDESDRPEGYDLPLVFRIGVAANVLGGEGALLGANSNHRAVLSVEAINSNDYSERLHIGGEYTLANLIALRGGYRLNYEEGNWSVGAGVSPNISGIEMRVDYAYVAYEFLDAPHRLTVSLGF